MRGSCEHLLAIVFQRPYTPLRDLAWIKDCYFDACSFFKLLLRQQRYCKPESGVFRPSSDTLAEISTFSFHYSRLQRALTGT